MHLTKSLCTLIEAWIAKSRHNNLHILSNRTKVPYSTLSRIAQGKLEKPKLEAVIAVLAVVADEDSSAEFLEQHLPSVAKIMKRTRPFPNSERELKADEDEFEGLMRDPIGFLLSQFLLSRAGISASRAKELFGQVGVDTIKRLEEKGLVTFTDGLWKSNFDFASQSLECNIDQVVSSAKAFKIDSLKVSAAVIRNLSESVSLGAAQEIAEETLKYIDRVRDIKEKNPGPHVFVNNVMLYLADPETAINEAEATK